jgi:SAM-dependent methyltransferase
MGMVAWVRNYVKMMTKEKWIVNDNDRTRMSDIDAYIKGGRKPWSRGYEESKFGFVKDVLSDRLLMEKFLVSEQLPKSYGYGYDERVIEYPWTITRLSDKKGRLLDAGSVFNFDVIVENPRISGKDFTVFTLAPEPRNYWQKGISYNYGDLRELPFRDGWFDEIISLSTLGHVGMNTCMYTKGRTSGKIGLEATKAVKELTRVLKCGGLFLGSVVFGKHQIIEWSDGSPFAEQFDSRMLEDLLAAFSPCSRASVSFYKYTDDGWEISTEEACRDSEYYNIHRAESYEADLAAAARAVALFEVLK